MAAGRPSIHAVPGQTGFADALAEGLIARFGAGELGLARLTLILPNNRAERAVTEAFVRASGKGLLLPRMAIVGDLDLGEKLGHLFDPIGEGDPIPPAIDPLERLLALARLIRSLSAKAPESAECIRLAREFARVNDQLLAEERSFSALADLDSGGLAAHWDEALALFASVASAWTAELERLGRIEAADRRNRLLALAAENWRREPPDRPIVVAGVTTAAPAIARLMRVISELPNGHVVLPGLDLAMSEEEWDLIRPAEPASDDEPRPVHRLTHPQYHLRHLLDAMGIRRDEVLPWLDKVPKRAQSRERLARSIFLPAPLSDRWQNLPAEHRELRGLRVMETANPEEEALLVAALARQALDTPARRVAIATPDRTLAARVAAHLSRWDIRADDTAGTALAETPAGSLVLAMAEAIGTGFAPVSLLALLKHPLIMAGDGRIEWLDHVRTLDRALRGPPPTPGLAGIASKLGERRSWRVALDWWHDLAATLAPLEALASGKGEIALADAVSALVTALESLGGPEIWSGEAGRSAGDLLQALAGQDRGADLSIAAGELAGVLRTLMADVTVRAAYGSHPRIAIYGLLEARLQSADLAICCGLNEGVWPALPQPDPFLAPFVRRQLGLPLADYRIGLSAQDLAGALAAEAVVLTRAARDAGAPTVASRFLLRLEAVAGGKLNHDPKLHEAVRGLDRRLPPVRLDPPAPMPSPPQRAVALSVTDLDRLRADPFSFYAKRVLRLPVLEAVEADPGPAWRGTVVHDILQRWFEDDSADPEALEPRARAFFETANLHPFDRALWSPRVMAGLQWVALHEADLRAAGRTMLTAEAAGRFVRRSIEIVGKADRIDRLPDGSLAIVDYKTGTPPSGKNVAAGYALQLGLLGLMAEAGAFEGVEGEATGFEYWSLGKDKASPTGFGFVKSPIKTGTVRSGMEPGTMIPETARYLDDALNRWLLGTEPFHAKIGPDLPGSTDYDQLIRLEEWYGRQETPE